jgi:hypothetical protein
MFDTFVLKLTNLYKKLFKKPEPIKEPLEKISRVQKGDDKGTFDFSTMDRTPLSKNTIALIEYFENGIKNSETPKIGGDFENEGTISKKLSRYETFINFLIEHNNDNQLPNNNFIIENCKYGKDGKFTRKIILSHKNEAIHKGDLVKNDKNRYILIRKEKY